MPASLSPLIMACCLLAAAPTSAPRRAAEAKPDPALDVYATPGELVDVGAGRRLNMRCAGSGAPTVLLESGNNADSMTWAKVQPRIAKFARVCAYDRAGTGFSDGGPLPRDLDANADDLFALLRAARIESPLILVGHSYGTNVVRRVADKHPADVAALVLLDPPPQDIGAFAPEFDKAEDADRAAGMVLLRQCEKGAENGQLDAPPLALKQCLRGPDPRFSATLNAAQHAGKLRPAFWQTIISISESNAAMYKQPVSKSESHGSMPLLILQPDAPFDDVPADIRKALEAARRKTQQAIAATSSRGKIVPVRHSSHDVQLDQPDAVVAAVATAINEAKPTHAPAHAQAAD